MSESLVRWGVLGTGKIIGKGGRALHRSSLSEWVGVAGRNEENSRRAANTYQVEKAYRNYQDLLDDPALDAVYIALLNDKHKEWTVRALDAGKHVLLEKPLALNYSEATEIQQAAMTSGKQVMEAHVWRFHPAHQTVKQWIDEGKIGDPVQLFGHFSFMAGENSTRWVQEWGGGSLYDIGCYPVAWSRFFLGKEPLEAECRLHIHPKHQVDARCFASLYFADGKAAQFSCAFDMANGTSYDVIGSEGRIAARFIGGKDERILTLECGDVRKKWSTDAVEPFVYQADAFSHAVLSGRSVPYGLNDAMKQQQAMDALFLSDKKKRRVSLSELNE